MRADGRHAGGFKSKLFETDSTGKFTRSQDGGYFIARGTLIENAVGGAADDLLIGNAAANRLVGNGGADAMFGGAGDDRLEGGSGNDVLHAGTGNNEMDGGTGLDTASYRHLYAASAPGVEPAGLTVSISGETLTVTKPIDGPIAASLDTDTGTSIERIEGTLRADTFTIADPQTDLHLKSGGGKDSVTIDNSSGALVLSMKDGTYPRSHELEGQTYSATVTDGTTTTYLDGFDKSRITLTPAKPQSEERDGSDPADTQATSLPIDQALRELDETRRHLSKSDPGALNPTTQLLNHPDTVAAFRTIVEHGTQSLEVALKSDMDAGKRAVAICKAGRQVMVENDLSIEPSKSPDLPEPDLEQTHGL